MPARANKGFDGRAFYRALDAMVQSRAATWTQVSNDTGVSISTLARLAHGRHPSAASLAALSAWSGLNPAQFVDASYRVARHEPLNQISSLLRADPALDAAAAGAMEEIFRDAYERLRKPVK